MLQPQLHEDILRRLSAVAEKFDMPVARLCNFIVATALEELEGVDPAEYIVADFTPFNFLDEYFKEENMN
ncbi:MAG: hypothetical protein AAB539_03670 [Patescibacteria group bacterium]